MAGNEIPRNLVKDWRIKRLLSWEEDNAQDGFAQIIGDINIKGEGEQGKPVMSDGHTIYLTLVRPYIPTHERVNLVGNSKRR